MHHAATVAYLTGSELQRCHVALLYSNLHQPRSLPGNNRESNYYRLPHCSLP